MTLRHLDITESYLESLYFYSSVSRLYSNKVCIIE
jgi:hypothetical protein